MKPYDLLKSWRSESAVDRVEGCRVLLHVHGFLTDGENEKVAKRIARWYVAGCKAKAKEE